MVGSGKGGVGKSVISILLANALASQGRRVLLSDADHSLPNLHILVGAQPVVHAEAMLSGDLLPGHLLQRLTSHLWLMAGDPDTESVFALSTLDRARLQRMLSELYRHFDAVVVDAGAGLGGVLLVSAFGASRVIVVTTPEPTALTDAFALVSLLTSRSSTSSIEVVVNRVLDEHDGAATFARFHTACSQLLGRSVRLFGMLREDAQLQATGRSRSDAFRALTSTPTAHSLRTLVAADPQLSRAAAPSAS